MARVGMKIVLALACLLPSVPGIAGPYADDLSKCLISSTTTEDKQALVRWIFSAISLHPSLNELSSITPQRRDAIDATAATLFQRLLAENCADQVRAAMQYEGSAAFGSSFELLGKVAATEMFQNPAVNTGIQGMLGKVDMKHLRDVLKPASP